jgi:hypothetical protein
VSLAEAPPRFLSHAGDSTMFGGAHSALVQASCGLPKLHRDFEPAGDSTMFTAEDIQPWLKLCASRQSSTEVFEPCWRLHNIRRSTFSLGQSSVPLTEAPPRFLTQAGDCTMFGGAHSALLEALCISPKLHRIFGPSRKLHNIQQSICSLG